MKRIVDIAELIEFDFRTGKLQTIPVDETLPVRLSDELENIKKQMGLKIFIQGVDDPEHFVRSYYENKGFLITRLPYVSLGWEHREYERNSINYLTESQKFIKDNYSLIEGSYVTTIDELFTKPGVPDFLAIKLNKENHIIDLFFVEVKSSNDAVRYKQILWVFSSNVPTKLIYCKEDVKVV